MLRMTRLFSCRDFWIMNGSGGWVWKYLNGEDDDFDHNDDMRSKWDWDFLKFQTSLQGWWWCSEKYLWEKWAARVWRFWVPEEQWWYVIIGDDDEYGGIYGADDTDFAQKDDMTWVRLSLENSKQQKSGIICFISLAVTNSPALGTIMISMIKEAKIFILSMFPDNYNYR